MLQPLAPFEAATQQTLRALTRALLLPLVSSFLRNVIPYYIILRSSDAYNGIAGIAICRCYVSPSKSKNENSQIVCKCRMYYTGIDG